MGGAEERMIQEFVGVTDAPLHVARHILEAHGWDLDTSVSFYIESGGVGPGVVEDMACSPPGHELQPTKEEEQRQPGVRARQRRATRREIPIVVRVTNCNLIEIHVSNFACLIIPSYLLRSLYYR